MKLPPLRKGCPRIDFSSKFPARIVLEASFRRRFMTETIFGFSLAMSLFSSGSSITSKSMAGWFLGSLSKLRNKIDWEENDWDMEDEKGVPLEDPAGSFDKLTRNQP